MYIYTLFDSELKKADERLATASPEAIPALLANIPLDIFGKLLLEIPIRYQNFKSFFPSMASAEIQNSWTGTNGQVLLNESLAFTKTLIYGYTNATGRNIHNARVLDYGCGWGRLIRLLYKFVPIDNIYGVDPWDESIRICHDNNVQGHLAISEYVPRTLPFDQKFDLIYAFSVFTHLSEKTAHVVLETLRQYISPEGILAITIRPQEYWHFHNQGALSTTMLQAHTEKGFAFMPHNRPPIDGDITYGDTSLSLEYIQANFPQWQIQQVEWNEIDPLHIIVFLKPV